MRTVYTKVAGHMFPFPSVWTAGADFSSFALEPLELPSRANKRASQYEPLLAAPQAFEDDHPDGPEDATGLTEGVTVSGVIDTDDDEDWFRFDLDAGDTVRFTVNRETYGPHVSLINEFGETVEQEDGTWVVEHAGTYYAVVSKEYSFGPDAYSFSWNRYVDDHGSSPLTATHVETDGTQFTGMIDDLNGGDQDWFSFTVEQNQVLSFSLLDWSSLTGTASLTLTLIQPFGETLYGINVYETGDSQPIHFDRAGTYFLVVDSLHSGGDYTLSISENVDDHGATPESATPIIINGPGIVGNYDFAQDRDFFSFDVNEPGKLVFELDQVGHPQFDAYQLVVFDADYNFVATEVLYQRTFGLDRTPYEYFSWDYDFEQAGSYFLMLYPLSAFPDNPRPPYTLTINTVFDDLPFNDEDATESLQQAQLLDLNGAAFNGTLDYNGDIDVFAVHVEAGDYFYIEKSFTWENPGAGVTSDLYPDDQARIVSAPSINFEDFHLFYAETSGVYYFAVSSILKTDGEPYQVSAVKADPAEVNFSYTWRVDTEKVEVGDVVTVTLDTDDFIGSGVASFFYEIDVEASETISISTDFEFSIASAKFLIFTGDGMYLLAEDPPYQSDDLIYTFGEAGTYVIQVIWDPDFGFSGNPPNAPPYEASVSFERHHDEQTNNKLTPTTLIKDGETIFAEIDFERDVDFFRFEGTAGENVYVDFQADDRHIVVRNVYWEDPETGYLIPFTGLDLRLGQSFTPDLHIPVDGTYYFEVEASALAVGAYSISVSSYPDDFASDTSSTGQMAVDAGVVYGTHEAPNDDDWFRVELVAGETYSIIADYVDPALDGLLTSVYDVDGNLVHSLIDIYGEGSSRWVPEVSGTYYVAVDSFNTKGDYTVEVSRVDTSKEKTSILSSFQLDRLPLNPQPNHIYDIYFADAGEAFWGETSAGWGQYDIDTIMGVLKDIEQYLNIEFRITTSPAFAEMVIVSNNDDVTYSIQWDNFVQAEIVSLPFDIANDRELAAKPGSYAYALILHGLIRGLGVGLPHEAYEGEGTTALPGVIEPYDLGDWNLNQGVYSAASFNFGWAGGPDGLSNTLDHGWQMGPMAVDLAILASWFGLDYTYNSGDDIYTLTGSNGVGTGYRSIWDSGGSDALVYNGGDNAVLDLRAATLYVEEGGGGFVSFVEGVWGGFTIANGVVIEKAFGGSGNDVLIGNGVDNVLRGGNGLDLLSGLQGRDILDGGNGADAVYYGFDADNGATSGVSVDLINQAAIDGFGDRDTLISIEDAYGSTLNDRISGNNAANVLSGLAGNDRIYGLDGADFLDGGDGNDSLFGGLGADTIEGGLDHDVLIGGDGDDVLRGDAGSDILSGDYGVDRLFGGADNDFLYGGPGADILYGEDGDDKLRGNQDDDTLSGGLGKDILIGNEGNDRLFGGDDADALLGHDGNDLLFGEFGVDYLYGNAGEDYLSGGEGNDILFGGDDNDTLLGDGENDRLFGEAGDDTLYGGTGHDLLLGGDGVDELFGGDGFDYLSGDAGADRLSGEGQDDLLYGGLGDDWLNGGSGKDKLFGGDGADELLGEAGNDVLRGEAGNDSLSGGEGQDVIVGGVGADQLSGGADGDIFYFAAGDSLVGASDTLTDFEAGDSILVGTHSFIGTNAFSASGAFEVRYASGSTSQIELDRDGDGVVDEIINVTGAHGFTSDGSAITALDGLV